MEDPGGFPSAIVFSDSWPEEEPLARLSKESSEQLPRLLATLMRRESQDFVGHSFWIWGCLKMVSSPKPNGFADHYPYEKWLFHWEYILFSDKPICLNFVCLIS